MKPCSKCKSEKPFSDFFRSKYSLSGYQSWCKECFKSIKTIDKEKSKIYGATFRAKNPEKVKEIQSRSRHKHAAKRNLYNKNYRKVHADIVRKSNANWVNNNRHTVNELAAKRRLSVSKATPAWANPFFVSEIYRLAQLRSKYLGKEFQVDHIVPILNSVVCGLHCESNLRVVLKETNHKKGNRSWPDMPSDSSIAALDTVKQWAQ